MEGIRHEGGRNRGCGFILTVTDSLEEDVRWKMKNGMGKGSKQVKPIEKLWSSLDFEQLSALMMFAVTIPQTVDGNV